MDAKYIEDKGLTACRDIKKDEIIKINYLDYILWVDSDYYETKNIKK